MTGNLLDVNFLVALVWKNHVQHRSARNWLSSHREEAFVTCTLTETSLICLSMNPLVVGEAVSFTAACSVLEQLKNHPAHGFWSMNEDFLALIPGMHVSAYRQVTDACLLGLAAARNGRLVTFDRKIVDILHQSPALEPHLIVVES